MAPIFDWASKSTVLITGGGSGIGLALALRFLAAGHEVIICGRRKEVLEDAAKAHQGLVPVVGDVATEAGRRAIAARILKDFPQTNVLVNNAGVLNDVPPLTSQPHGEDALWQRHRQELAINLDAPMHLSMLLLPHLTSKPNALIVNVSSALAFVPLPSCPVYSATKAALHSFTLSLREQLKATAVSVIEIVPPVVKTDMPPEGLKAMGEDIDEFTDGVWSRMLAGDVEIGFKFSEMLRLATVEEKAAVFANLSSMSH